MKAISRQDNWTYTTELLAKHDNPSRESGTTIPRNGEEFDELSEEVLALVGLALELDTNMGVVCVTSGLDIGEAKALEGPECLIWLFVLNVPSLQGVRFGCR